MQHFEGGPGADLKWAIPAQHVNTLFGELMPRVAAGVWLGDEDAVNGDFEWPAPNTDAVPKILEWIAKFVNADGTQGDIPSSDTFKRQLIGLREYLSFAGTIADGDGNSIAPVLMPIRFVAEGGHDYLLSSDGMDLIAPPRIERDPEGHRSVLWYYTFRDSGRRPIGLPTVFGSEEGYNPPGLVDAPTGASQLNLPIDVVTKLIHCLPDGGPGPSCGAVQAALSWVHELLECKEPPSGEVVDKLKCVLVDELGMNPKAWAELEELLCSDDYWHKALQAICEWLMVASEGCTPVTPELFQCSVVLLRDWQLTGAVFRAIQEVFPRIIADFWHDNLPDNPGLPFDNANEDIREQIKNRLETGLPPAGKMVFQIDEDGVPANWDAIWDTEDIMVTNQGVFFPREEAVPGLNVILQKIVKGLAGNPVFTATARSV
ncbi:MAG: hypothetical protein ACR2QM_11850 [Longimicrobiales bacterium]